MTATPSKLLRAEPILAVNELSVAFPSSRGTIQAVDSASWTLAPSEIVAIVGESGSGKSVSALSVLGLLPGHPKCQITGSVKFDGQELLSASESHLRGIRGNEIGMIFQDPMSSMNPLHTVGRQIGESLKMHRSGLSRKARRDRVIQLLADVGIPDPSTRASQYPHEFSGGMRQRAMIAMAIANSPRVLIADEPTTALDVTIQAQIVKLLVSIRESAGTAIVLITHDLGLVAEIADRVIVMYSARVVEHGPVLEVFEHPSHPYTVGLLASIPRLDARVDKAHSIPGQPPVPTNRPTGCAFHPRCPLGRNREKCQYDVPNLQPNGHNGASACHFHTEISSQQQNLYRAIL